MISALVLIEAESSAIPEAAEALAGLPSVSEVYSVAGRVDLVAVVRVGRHDDLASVVTDEIAKTPGVRSTETLIAFRAYSRHDLEGLFSVGLEEELQRRKS